MFGEVKLLKNRTQGDVLIVKIRAQGIETEQLCSLKKTTNQWG